ncbi:hypothetical protein D3C72_2240350 [compost metagenome]
MSAVSGLALELQLFDGIEGEDIVGVGRDDGGDVTGADGGNPGLDELADFVFGGTAHGRVL